MTWQFTLTGLLIGVLVGLTGMGGGALLTPILVIVFGFKPTYAVGTDILHGAVFKSFGAVRHRRLGNVHAHLTLWMFAGSGPMSLLGVAVAGWLASSYGDGVQSAEGYAVGAALVLGAAGLVAKTFVKRGVQPSEAGFVLRRKDKIRAVLIGAVFGFIVGLTSVGSGTFFGLVMVMIYPLTIARIVGTDIFHAAALLWVAGFGHLVQGNVDLHAMGWLLIGSIPGNLDLEPVHAAHPSGRAPARSRRRARAQRRQAPERAGRRLRDHDRARRRARSPSSSGWPPVCAAYNRAPMKTERPDDPGAAAARRDGDRLRGDAAPQARA